MELVKAYSRNCLNDHSLGNDVICYYMEKKDEKGHQFHV